MDVYQINTMSALLKDNTYPGRGIVVGLSKNGKKAVLAYFIMGRSENSRNRVFVQKGSDVIIHPFDASKVEDPSLIIYAPIRKCGSKVIVTNGDQTDTVFEGLHNGKSFEEALESRCFEPDAPNFTPRISAILNLEKKAYSYKMSILKSADPAGGACNRFTYSYAAVPGLGHFLHTYLCDGNPIPTFTGEPERVEIPDDIDEFTDALWCNLNAQNKISLYVRYIDLETGVEKNRMINKNK